MRMLWVRWLLRTAMNWHKFLGLIFPRILDEEVGILACSSGRGHLTPARFQSIMTAHTNELTMCIVRVKVNYDSPTPFVRIVCDSWMSSRKHSRRLRYGRTWWVSPWSSACCTQWLSDRFFLQSFSTSVHSVWCFCRLWTLSHTASMQQHLNYKVVELLIAELLRFFSQLLCVWQHIADDISDLCWQDWCCDTIVTMTHNSLSRQVVIRFQSILWSFMRLRLLVCWLYCWRQPDDRIPLRTMTMLFSFPECKKNISSGVKTHSTERRSLLDVSPLHWEVMEIWETIDYAIYRTQEVPPAKFTRPLAWSGQSIQK